MLIIIKFAVNRLTAMLEVATWVKDGDYRLKTLRLLVKNPHLPSELADLLNINRASMSRILSDMKEKGLVASTESNSRTVSYSITDIGRNVLRQILDVKSPNYELYGIYRHNKDSTILTKNIFTTYLPISAALYMSDCGIDVIYLSKGEKGLQLSYERFWDLLGISNEQLHKVKWNSQGKNRRFRASRRAPGIDMIPALDGRELIELEVKLTVVPTSYQEKVTEMIVRQNTQFNFAERLCYYYDKYLPNPTRIEDLKALAETKMDKQRPFIIHGFWKTIGKTALLDTSHTLDVMLISDFAYLDILLSSRLDRNGVPTRIGRVLDIIIEWINEFKNNKTITYKDDNQGSLDHLKNTIYLVDHIGELRKNLYEPRLDFSDLLRILPLSSVEKLSPERRIDQSIIYTLAKECPVERSND